MAVSQSLSVTEVPGSVNSSTNTSKVRILWTSTQTNNSHNNNTKTAKYYVSINGGAETEYTVSYTLPLTSTKTIVDVTLTVTHKGDGSGTVSVRTWMDTSISAGVVEKSKTLTLTTIPRASTISSALNRTLGEACSVSWTPLSNTFTYKLKFEIGSWNHTTEVIKPSTTLPYTYTSYNISLDAAHQLPNAPAKGTMTVSLFTYSDSNGTIQVGSSSRTTITVTVPDNTSTKPSVSMPLANVISLGSPFNALYIQGKSRVESALSGEGKYSANITTKELYVDGKSNGTLVSDYLSKSGKVTVKGRVYDSRGYYNEATEEIDVIEYSKPQIRPTSDESEVIAVRCDSSGNISDSGTYLKIKAMRHYSLVQSGNMQYNHCQIRYRYKVEGGEYSGWNTILSYSASSDEVETDALLGGSLSVQKTYYVQIQALDDLGESSTIIVNVPTDKAYIHKAGSINALGVGKYAEDENTVDIAEDMTVKVRGNLIVGDMPISDTGWVSLGLSDKVTASASGVGQIGAGCYYRVINENHVYVAFNCACTYAGSNLTVNATMIPTKYRSSRNVYTLVPTGSRFLIRTIVDSSGKIIIDYVQSLIATGSTMSADVPWIDAYIDYWI